MRTPHCVKSLIFNKKVNFFWSASSGRIWQSGCTDGSTFRSSAKIGDPLNPSGFLSLAVNFWLIRWLLSKLDSFSTTFYEFLPFAVQILAQATRTEKLQIPVQNTTCKMLIKLTTWVDFTNTLAQSKDVCILRHSVSPTMYAKLYQ